MEGVYSCVWEFIVRPETISEFERQYGMEGAWVALFRRSEGYVDTRLLRDRRREMRYLTVDRWRSELAYRQFRQDFAVDYARLDRECEHLTLQETPLGEFRE